MQNSLKNYGKFLMIWDQQQNPNQSLVKLGFLLKMRCFDKRQIACHFNQYFTTVAASLVSKLPGASDKYAKSFVNSFYRNKNVFADAFTFSPVSEDKVRASLSTLSVNKATGLDLIPSRFLRDSAEVTAISSKKKRRMPGWFLFLRKIAELMLGIIGQSQFFQPYQRYLSV